MLALRLATAAVALPIVFGAVYLGVPFMAAVASIAGALAVFEYNRLSKAFDMPPGVIFSCVLTVGMILAAVWGPRVFLAAFAASVLAMIVFHLTSRGPGLGWSLRIMGAMGPFHIGMPLSVAVLIRGLDYGLEWVVTGLLCTMAADTGAYAVGKLIGRRPLTPVISPNKTWEGAIGGGVAGVLAAVGLTLWLDLPLPLVLAPLLGVSITVGALVGDLVISTMKRIADVKDTGAFLPGHGGFLDRMDSLLLALPITFVWQVWTI